ncbi:MAG: hypothetical protein U5Q44_12025 [Dehalococcoidia bacterium]|nr:hypothetical protein [Dehalococcoidia bacterium]
MAWLRFPGVPTGTYTICETPQDGYEVVGSTGDDGQGEVPGECRTGVEVFAEGADINTSIRFFNRPVGDVRVEKRTLEDGEPVDERDGWTITVTGCDYADTRTTGDDGVVLFESVPACDDLSVIEDPDSKPGFAATSGTSRSISLSPGETANVTFTNEAFTAGDIPTSPRPPPQPMPHRHRAGTTRRLPVLVATMGLRPRARPSLSPNPQPRRSRQRRPRLHRRRRG